MNADNVASLPPQGPSPWASVVLALVVLATVILLPGLSTYAEFAQ